MESSQDAKPVKVPTMSDAKRRQMRKDMIESIVKPAVQGESGAYGNAVARAAATGLFHRIGDPDPIADTKTVQREAKSLLASLKRWGAAEKKA